MTSLLCDILEVMELTRLLAEVSDLWLDPETPWRQAAIDALMVSTGYTRPAVLRAVENCFSVVTRPDLEALLNSAPPRGKRDPQTILHIAAGNVFTAWLHGAVITLLLGNRCWLKPSSREPVFAAWWKKSVAQVDAGLGAAIQIVAWDTSLRDQVDKVVAYGNDNTLAELRAYFQPVPVIGYGSKLSVAIAFEESMQQDAWTYWREQALRDIEPFDLEGCLSPQLIYVEGQNRKLWLMLQTSRPFPQITNFMTLAVLRQGIEKHRALLSCIGIAGNPDRVNQIRECLALPRSVRLCLLGEMQKPELTWNNGGISLLEELGKDK